MACDVMSRHVVCDVMSRGVCDVMSHGVRHNATWYHVRNINVSLIKLQNN